MKVVLMTSASAVRWLRAQKIYGRIRADAAEDAKRGLHQRRKTDE